MTATTVEQLIRRDRAILVAGLVLLTLLSWIWVLLGAGMGMSALEMTRTGLFPHLGQPLVPMQPMTPMTLTAVQEFLLMVSMWWIMMIAMMLPSATPMMLLHAGVVRRAQSKGQMAGSGAATGTFLAGYLLVWLGFSVVATLLQMALVAAGSLSPMMLWSNSVWLSAAFLALAGLYQITPLKQRCLEHCRSPADWLSRNWRPGRSGALRLGVRHGAYCLGCCWSLMLLLFVGGVMNVIWIAALAIFVLIEKLGVSGMRSGWLSASLLWLWAVAMVLV